MNKLIAIRREDKNIWEKRVPIIPEHIKLLAEKHGIETIIQPFPERTFADREFENAGAVLSEDISEPDVMFAVKEIPIEMIGQNKAYVFFSHTIKGQSYNMPLLQRFIDQKSTLIDYEKITDENGKRLVFFGRFAGIAGMIDGFFGFGQRLKSIGIESPFMQFKQTYQYSDIEEAKGHIKLIGEDIKLNGIPGEIKPVIIGVTGYGNVSRGAQEIIDILPHKEIRPDELDFVNKDDNIIYKVVFKEEDIVKPVSAESDFDLTEYFNHPEKYISQFEKYLPKLSVLVNAIYWDERYPRLLTREFVRENFQNLRLKVISDISCDINGSIEFTEKATEPDMPGFIYNPVTGEISDGFDGEGIVNIAVDNLPTELPRDASVEFSNSLFPFIPGIVNANFDEDFERCDLPPEIKRAVVVYKGELTPEFRYLDENLKSYHFEQ